MLPENRVPTHPGEILSEEFLKPMGITQTALAEQLKVPVQRVNTLISGKRGVTPETALLLAMAFETTPQFWMNLQTNFDLWNARHTMQITVEAIGSSGSSTRGLTNRPRRREPSPATAKKRDRSELG